MAIFKKRNKVKFEGGGLLLFEEVQQAMPAEKAYVHHGAVKLLLVKGAKDYIISNGEILATVTEPGVPMLEPIGGTSDTVTGLVAALVYAKLEPHKAAIIAARANRMAGKYTCVTPATIVSEIISHFPYLFKDYLCEWSGACYTKGGN